MEAHNSFFTNSAGPAFNSTHYHFGHPFATYDTWSLSHLDVVPHPTALLTLSPLLPPDDSFQMQHLRFPTPPITPPFGSVTLQNAQALSALAAASSPVSPSSTRTQSVIMKIDQHTPAGNAAFDSSIVSCHEQPSEAACSENSSPKNLDYRCDWIDCNRYHNSLDSLVAHVTKVHAVASPIDGLYYCRWSGCTRARGFSARYKMLVHARTHTKEKPHQCQLCTKSFSRAENLKIHIRSHSGEKPYLCTYKGCHKAYSNSSDRFKHTRTHAMDKPYMCKVPGCQKRYTDPSSLRKHVKTFKHNVQLIRTTTATYMSKNSTAVSTLLTKSSPTTSLSTTALNRHRSSKYSPSTVLHQHLHTEPEEQIPAYQLGSPPCLTTIGAHPQQFYVGSLEEDVCHIKATQLDYYYTAANGTVTPPNSITPSYWIAHKSRNDESIMGLETPLDLRLRRS